MTNHRPIRRTYYFGAKEVPADIASSGEVVRCTTDPHFGFP